MAKKKTAAKSTELDAKEFFAAINDIEKERGIPKTYMIEKITQALVAAYKRDHEGITDNVTVDADEEKGEVRMYVKKDVVETVDNPHTEMSLEDARKALPRAQGMREAERGMVFDEFSAKEHEILTGSVTRVDERTGSVSIRLTSGGEFTDAYLSAGEQVKGEVIHEGDRVKVYVVEVRRSTRGPQVLISRTHPGLVRRLFELEVPEIYDGTVEVMSIAREAGSRTKLAVWSEDPNVDPIGACVGPRGQRVNAIVEELRGEKVDIIKWSEDPAEYVAAALAPADVLSVTELGEGKSCRVVVPDDQLSLAIGKEGQNARLAARLTGYKIDIRPASAPEPPEEELDGGVQPLTEEESAVEETLVEE